MNTDDENCKKAETFCMYELREAIYLYKGSQDEEKTFMINNKHIVKE